MIEKDKVQLTEEWILTMVYGEPKSSSELIEIGCRVMVYGWEYDDFMKILGDMEQKNYLFHSQTTFDYRITDKGQFTIKKHALLPLTILTEKPELLRDFIMANKENCDILFLESLSTEPDKESKISKIIKYSEQNYEQIAKIVNLFLKSYHL